MTEVHAANKALPSIKTLHVSDPTWLTQPDMAKRGAGDLQKGLPDLPPCARCIVTSLYKH